MDYQNTLKYLYESVPMFQQIGGEAYKPDMDTTHQLDEYFGHPHQQFKTIHIAGTNGKGSCSHTIAAVLQSAGYRVGLYTSPHLIDFRERIRINGEMISEEYVVSFVEDHRSFFEPLHPSFFELTTAMAFRYFADQKVDVAVIETGMGGRLDCTNIIKPDLCVITNISFDHMQYLGNTLTQIATEKAGIIKEGTPVIIGQVEKEIEKVFTSKAEEMNAPIHYAEELIGHIYISWVAHEELIKKQQEMEDTLKTIKETEENSEESMSTGPYLSLHALESIIANKKDAILIMTPHFIAGIYMELSGMYQADNIYTIMSAIKELKNIGYHITDKDYYIGFGNVCKMTGIMGRWQRLQSYPEVICDTGHNVDGIGQVCVQLEYINENLGKKLHIVFGMVNDKDISGVLELLPQDATYYFTKASVKRALAEDELLKMAKEVGLKGASYPTVVDAMKAAKKECLPEDFIFVGGSSFIVADLLANRDALDLY